MKEKIREYFSFTRKERLGVIVLLLIIVLLFIVPYWIRRPPGTEDPEATRQFAPLIGKLAKDSAATGEERRPGSSMQAFPTTSQGRYYPDDRRTAPATLFYFDPNQLGESDWQKLGLTPRQSRILAHYTGKGGHFRSPADLEKIYGLSLEDRNRLMPYVRIRASVDRQDKLPFTSHRLPMPEAPSPFHPGKYPRKKAIVIDINLADSSQWEQLPGIGEKLAARIIRFREKLGGFYSVFQVAETFGLPDSTFQKIQPWLTSDSAAVQRIDLNTVSEEAMKQHPYIRWKLATVLIRYREQHGKFQSADELGQVALLDAAALKRLRPYLAFSK